MMRGFTKLLLTLALLSGACAVVTLSRGRSVVRATVAATRPQVMTFGGERLAAAHQDPHVQYDLDPGREKFFLQAPSGVGGEAKCGLVVFMHSSDWMTEIPAGWAAVLTERRLLFVAPQDAGNGQQVARRLGLALLAAAKVGEHYPVDKERVYAAGFSGGARIAGTVAFYHSEVFRGTIQCSGSNFPGAVARRHAPPAQDTEHYGLMDATAEQIEKAKGGVRFVVITGAQDFRYDYLRDIFEGGFQAQGYKALLVDIPKGEHAICDGATLRKALEFIERK